MFELSIVRLMRSMGVKYRLRIIQSSGIKLPKERPAVDDDGGVAEGSDNPKLSGGIGVTDSEDFAASILESLEKVRVYIIVVVDCE